MKKEIKTGILLILIFCILCSSSLICKAENSRVTDVFGEKYVEYDVNADGYFDIRDLVRLKARLAGNKKTINLMAADANQDGVINSIDLGVIKKLLLEAD